MKILHISTFTKGGAGIAAMRLHHSLLSNGHDSTFLILKGKQTDSVFLYKRNYLFAILIKIFDKLGIPHTRSDFKILKYRRRFKFELFSFATTSYTQLHAHPLVKEADVINLHWVSNFIDYKTFFRNIKKPIIWTLHDLNPLQGGFHYKEDELKYAKFLYGLDEQQYIIKKHVLSQKKVEAITVITPSSWLLNISLNSEILGKFSHRHIPYGLRKDIFKPLDKEYCKNKFALSKQKITVLFVAENINNYRKGFDMILDMANDVDLQTKCEFVAVGKISKSYEISGILCLGTVKDEVEMSLIYNAADIFVLPSREDNLPNTMLESLCCGTPVVGFSVGGIKESVTNDENGILANTVSTQALRDSLHTCIQNINKFDRGKISSTAHLKYDEKIQLKAYLTIYDTSLLSEITT